MSSARHTARRYYGAHEYVRPVRVQFVVNCWHVAIGGEDDKNAYRGDFAAEAEVVKLRRKEAMVGTLLGQDSWSNG